MLKVYPSGVTFWKIYLLYYSKFSKKIIWYLKLQNLKKKDFAIIVS